MSKCRGCGALLQSDDNKELGYISKEKMDKAKYCERCFKVIHYNEKVVTHIDNINDNLLESLNKFDGVILFFLDFLNVNEETIRTFLKIRTKKSLIISKYDILPKSFNDNKIIDYLRSNYHIKDDIYFLSTKKNINTKSILIRLEEKNMSRVCITGYTNAGKSTFLNKILENNQMESGITTSLNPNTTVDFMEFKIGNLTIFDSPGFIYQENIYSIDDFKFISKIHSKNMIKPITYQVKKISSVIVEDVLRISSNLDNSFTFYMSNDLDIKRVFEDNKLCNLSCYEFDIKDNQDVVIKGLGFINIKKACRIKIYIMSDYLFEIRDSMF